MTKKIFEVIQLVVVNTRIIIKIKLKIYVCISISIHKSRMLRWRDWRSFAMFSIEFSVLIFVSEFYDMNFNDSTFQTEKKKCLLRRNFYWWHVLMVCSLPIHSHKNKIMKKKNIVYNIKFAIKILCKCENTKNKPHFDYWKASTKNEQHIYSFTH